MKIDDPQLVRREYASLDRFQRRRIDVTGWLRFGGDDEWTVLLRAIAEVRPSRVLAVGAGDGTIASMVAAPEVVCVDQSEAAVEAARARGLDARLADVQALPVGDPGETSRISTASAGLESWPRISSASSAARSEARPCGRRGRTCRRFSTRTRNSSGRSSPPSARTRS